MAKTLKEIIRRWPSPEAKFWVEKFLSRVSHNPNVLAVVVFGSAVRSVEYCADVDVLVVYDRKKPATGGHPVDVDIRWHERNAVERLIAEGHELLGWVLRHGELICQQDNYWTNLRESWGHRMPFPSAIVADERADRAEQLHAELVSMGDLDAAHEQSLVALTQRARSLLIRKGIFPASRPELPTQLRQIGEFEISARLEEVMGQRERT